MSKIKDLFDRINNSIVRYKSIIRNFQYLSIVQIINIALPLITYPYLIRILGADLYGRVIFANTVSFYFVTLINYGFDIYATKEISIYRDSKEILSKIFSRVVLSKILLFFLSAFVFLILLFTIDSFKNYKLLFCFSFLLCLNEVFLPIWYFQGIEKMKFITIFISISRIVFTVLVFIVVKSNSDYIFVPLLHFVGGFISIILSIFIVREHGISFQRQNIASIAQYLKSSAIFFFSRASALFRDKTNTILLGVFLDYRFVAYYDLAEKVVTILKAPLSILNQSIFPHSAKSKDTKLINKFMLLSFLVGTLIYIFLLFFSDKIVLFLGGEEMLEAKKVLAILGMVLTITGVTYIAGSTLLVSLGYSKQFAQSIFYSTLLYFLLVLIFYIFNQVGLYQLTYLIFITRLFELLYCLFFSVKFKLIKIGK